MSIQKLGVFEVFEELDLLTLCGAPFEADTRGAFHRASVLEIRDSSRRGCKVVVRLSNEWISMVRALVCHFRGICWRCIADPGDIYPVEYSYLYAIPLMIGATAVLVGA